MVASQIKGREMLELVKSIWPWKLLLDRSSVSRNVRFPREEEI
jgi:hypothetical protein